MIFIIRRCHETRDRDTGIPSPAGTVAQSGGRRGPSPPAGLSPWQPDSECRAPRAWWSVLRRRAAGAAGAGPGPGAPAGRQESLRADDSQTVTAAGTVTVTRAVTQCHRPASRA